MEQRFVVLDRGSEAKIYKIPINQTARLINEFPDRKPEIFEALKDAKEAALAIVNRIEANAKPSITKFSARLAPQNELLRATLSELTEDRVETYYF